MSPSSRGRGRAAYFGNASGCVGVRAEQLERGHGRVPPPAAAPRRRLAAEPSGAGPHRPALTLPQTTPGEGYFLPPTPQSFSYVCFSPAELIYVLGLARAGAAGPSMEAGARGRGAPAGLPGRGNAGLPPPGKRRSPPPGKRRSPPTRQEL